MMRYNKSNIEYYHIQYEADRINYIEKFGKIFRSDFLYK